jgi:cytoskeletal protein RodZ
VRERLYKLRDAFEKQKAYKELGIEYSELRVEQESDEALVMWFYEVEDPIRFKVEFNPEKMEIIMTISGWKGYFWVITIQAGERIETTISFGVTNSLKSKVFLLQNQ